MKAWAARRLVICASNWCSAGYNAYCRADLNGWDTQGRYVRFWNKGASIVCNIVLPIASRLDNKATGQQMVEECWWG